MRERERKKKEKRLYCRPGRAVEERQAPSEGTKDIPRALFGNDRAGVTGVDRMMHRQLIGALVHAQKAGHSTFQFWQSKGQCPREALSSAMLTCTWEKTINMKHLSKNKIETNLVGDLTGFYQQFEELRLLHQLLLVTSVVCFPGLRVKARAPHMANALSLSYITSPRLLF